jgi:hypothetical protein
LLRLDTLRSVLKRLAKQFPIAQRLAFRDDWFRLAQKHGLKSIYRAIAKKRFLDSSHATFGSGISINPHVAAFPLVARVVDDFFKSLPGSPLGIFISLVTESEKGPAHSGHRQEI